MVKPRPKSSTRPRQVRPLRPTKSMGVLDWDDSIAKVEIVRQNRLLQMRPENWKDIGQDWKIENDSGQ